MINTHLIASEVKVNFKNLMIWTGVVVAFTVLIMAFFPSIQMAGDDLTALLDSLPEGLLKGMGMDEFMMTTGLGFYRVYYGIYIIIIMGVYCFSTGAGIFTKEEAKHTIEFIMSKPISRLEYFFSKSISAFVLYFLLVLIQAIIALLAITWLDTETIDISRFVALHMHGAALLFFFMALGIVSSVVINPTMNFMGLGVGLVFGTYLIDALAQSSTDLEWIGYISPFYYTDFNVTDAGYQFNAISTSIFFLLGLGLTILASRLFLRRDFLTL